MPCNEQAITAGRRGLSMAHVKRGLMAAMAAVVIAWQSGCALSAPKIEKPQPGGTEACGSRVHPHESKARLAAHSSAPAPAWPDYERFNEADADRFNQTAKRRPLVYTRLAEYLVARFELGSQPGIGIDVGGGPGDLVLELATSTTQFYWINTDINAWYARPFFEKALALGCSQRTGFLFADAGALPFKNQYADLVISRGAYQYWENLEMGLHEIHRILKPGGWAFIGRGFPPTMPEAEVRSLRAQRLVGGPTYDPDNDAKIFLAIVNKLGVDHYQIIRHQPKNPALSYGVWLCFRKGSG